MLAYNEHEGVPVDMEYLYRGVPQNPTTSHYYVWCQATNQQVQGLTQITVDAVDDVDGITRYRSSFTIPGSTNAIQNDRNKQEVKIAIVIANKDLDTEWSNKYSYVVNNLPGR